MLQFLWNGLAYAGVANISDRIEQKHVLLVNSLAIVVAVFSALNVVFSAFLFGLDFFSIMISAYVLIQLLVVVCNQHEKYLLARLLFFISSSAFLGAGSFLFGYESNFHFFLPAAILVTFFIFPQRQRVYSYLASLLLLAIFSYIQITKPQNQFSIAPEALSLSRDITSIGTLVLIAFFAIYIKSSFLVTERYLQAEQHKSEKLLQNILPQKVIDQLRENPETIAERFEECTVLFSDIVGFSELSRRMQAVDVVRLLNEIFSAFDDLAEKHQLEKIKTIGDAYMAVGGLPDPHPDHAERIARFAIDMLGVIQEYRQKNDFGLEIRIGIASGTAVAGVIGKKKFIYDLWGDSVNTASRMESHGLPGQIQVTESTYELLKGKFNLSERGTIDVKGMGLIRSFLLNPEPL